jgi:glucose/arabinose dehydrogenase
MFDTQRVHNVGVCMVGDGLLYVVTEEDDAALLRIEPVE